jgi:hypothetical protein
VHTNASIDLKFDYLVLNKSLLKDNKMAKNKTKKGPKGKPKRDTAPNMFERLSNRKRFDVLGRKPKGDVRSVNKLRSAATEKVRRVLA